MSQPVIGSRYDLHVTRKGAAESKAARDYFAVHPGDIEKVQDEEDVPGITLCGLSDGLSAALPVLPQSRYLAQIQRPSGVGFPRDAANRQLCASPQNQ